MVFHLNEIKIQIPHQLPPPPHPAVDAVWPLLRFWPLSLSPMTLFLPLAPLKLISTSRFLLFLVRTQIQCNPHTLDLIVLPEFLCNTSHSITFPIHFLFKV